MNAPMRGRLVDMSIGMNRKYRVTVELDIDYREQFDQLREHELDIEIKRHRERRSRDANAFCWALCAMIGNAMYPPVPKEDVYRRAIREVGEYEPLPLKEEAVSTFQERWQGKGTGWFAEVIDDSKLPGYKLVFAYYGSSTYDTKVMSRLIDHLIDETEQMGLTIPLSRKEVDRLKETWGVRISTAAK